MICSRKNNFQNSSKLIILALIFCLPPLRIGIDGLPYLLRLNSIIAVDKHVAHLFYNITFHLRMTGKKACILEIISLAFLVNITTIFLSVTK